MSTNSWWLMAFKKHVDIARNLIYQFREIEPIFGMGRNAGSIVINLNCKVIAEISDDREIERGEKREKTWNERDHVGINSRFVAFPAALMYENHDRVSEPPYFTDSSTPNRSLKSPFIRKVPHEKWLLKEMFPSEMEHFGTLVASWVGVATKPRFVW